MPLEPQHTLRIGVATEALSQSLRELATSLRSFNQRLPQPVDPPPVPFSSLRVRKDVSPMLSLSLPLHNLCYDNAYTNRICGHLIWNTADTDVQRWNYLDLDGEKLSYLPAGRVHEQYPDGSWKPAGRQSGRPSRVIRGVLGVEGKALFSDKEFEDFTNIIKGTDVRTRGTFDLVEGDDIRRFYNGRRYAGHSGSLQASCMRYDECESYLRVYVRNSAIIKMLILRDRRAQEHIHGRALVWMIPGCETPIMDRVYGSDVTIQVFRQYAAEQGWYYRLYNTYQNPTAFIKDGEEVHLAIKVALPKFRFDLFPYMDTLKFFNSRTGVFANQYDEHAGPYLYELTDTHGNAGVRQNWLTYPNDHKTAESSVQVIDAPTAGIWNPAFGLRPEPLPDVEDDAWATDPVEDDNEEIIRMDEVRYLEEESLINPMTVDVRRHDQVQWGSYEWEPPENSPTPVRDMPIRGPFSHGIMRHNAIFHPVSRSLNSMYYTVPDWGAHVDENADEDP